MDHNFTELVGKRLETAADERDYEAGALYLLKMSGNAIMYRNITAAIDKHKAFIEYQLQKYYNFRVQDLTHAQVVEMESKAEEIVAEHISFAAELDKVPHKWETFSSRKLIWSLMRYFQLWMPNRMAIPYSTMRMMNNANTCKR